MWGMVVLGKGRDKSIRRFTVKGSEARNYNEALKKFEQWHNRYYSSDPIRIIRVEHERTYVITYKILDKHQQRLGD